jgi:hypothetical protein
MTTITESRRVDRAAFDACDDAWVKLRSHRLILAGWAEAWLDNPTDRNLARMREANAAAHAAEIVHEAAKEALRDLD